MPTTDPRPHVRIETGAEVPVGRADVVLEGPLRPVLRVRCASIEDAERRRRDVAAVIEGAANLAWREATARAARLARALGHEDVAREIAGPPAEEDVSGPR